MLFGKTSILTRLSHLGRNPQTYPLWLLWEMTKTNFVSFSITYHDQIAKNLKHLIYIYNRFFHRPRTYMHIQMGSLHILLTQEDLHMLLLLFHIHNTQDILIGNCLTFKPSRSSKTFGSISYFITTKTTYKHIQEQSSKEREGTKLSLRLKEHQYLDIVLER